jgi:curved DNA-binding protein CbpA
MTLKKRYRKLVKIYHPDIQGIKTTNQKLIAANEMIKKINNAVEIVRKYIVKTEGTKDNLN